MLVFQPGVCVICQMQSFPDTSAYETLIFDLGGVIINLDTQATYRAFLRHNPQITPEILHHDVPVRYETGLISDAQFRDEVRGLVSPHLSDSEIDEAWNAMILDIPAWRIEMLQQLRNNHQVMLLSNTNAIHIRRVEEEVLPHGLESIEELFDQTYYSYKMKKRKPNTDIYEQVIAENSLNPEKTLFIDDNPHNITGARDAGLDAFHLTDPDILKKLLNG